MKYNFLLIFLSVLLFSNCKEDKAIENRKLAIEEEKLRIEREKIELQKAGTTTTPNDANTTETVKTTTTHNGQINSNFGDATISGTSVIMRSNHSTSAQVKGKFKSNERVLILDEFNPSNNSNEAITKTAVKLTDNNGNYKYRINPGKAVQIVDADEGVYDVKFYDKKYGYLYATINSEDLELLSGEKWYYVKRSNGTTGWVYSKFVNR